MGCRNCRSRHLTFYIGPTLRLIKLKISPIPTLQYQSAHNVFTLMFVPTSLPSACTLLIIIQDSKRIPSDEASSSA